MTRIPSFRSIAALAVALIGCAPRAPGGPATTPPLPGPPATRAQSLERLAALREQRHAEPITDYRLGEGDVVQVQAYTLPDLNQRVRVDGNGAITLPLLGTVPVKGKTVAEVQRDLTQRLAKFMYNPTVTVFVEDYHGAQVAVMGAVQRPGLVSQTDTHGSVLDAISAAGGLTADAGTRIYLLPSENRKNPNADLVVAQLRQTTRPSDLDGNAAPIMIDTADVDPEVQRAFLSVPVHGGDVILVPPNGTFVADGWLEKPGTYPVTPGMTVRAAIATAGGFLFPAKKTNVRIVRSGPAGQTEVRTVDYTEIEDQKAPDVFIHQGDVVQVNASIPKVIPYGIYKGIVDIFRLGAGIRVGA